MNALACLRRAEMPVSFAAARVSHRGRFVLAILAALALPPLVARADPLDMDFSVMGMLGGHIDITGYTAGTAMVGGNAIATADIGMKINTAKNAASTATVMQKTKNKMADWFKGGLATMQTARFEFDSGESQQMFQGNGSMGPVPLTGTFSDPPIGGLVKFTGGNDAPNDATPWYGGSASGTLPGTPPAAPFHDKPQLPFNASGGTDGLLGLLVDGMGMPKDGRIIFETVVVGVKSEPPNLPATTAIDERLTGKYMVVPLKSFTWGLDVKFTGSMAGGITASDYTVTQRPLTYLPEASADFKGAFDQMGPNAALEWMVCFVDHAADPIPDPTQPGGGGETPSGPNGGGRQTLDPGVPKTGFQNLFLDNLHLAGGAPSLADPLLGAQVIIADALQLDALSSGTAYFDDTTILVAGPGGAGLQATLTANTLVVDPGTSETRFQGELVNVVINNPVGSPFLNDLLALVGNGDRLYFMYYSDLYNVTGAYSLPGFSEGRYYLGGVLPFPEFEVDNAELPEPSAMACCGAAVLAALAAARRRRGSYHNSQRP